MICQKFNYEHIESFVISRSAIVYAFLWGFFEATFFFIVPDVFFGFTALFIPLFGILHGIVSIFGSMIGGIVMYRLALHYPLTLTNFLSQIPGINEQMVSEVYANLQHMGFKALFLAPWRGTPYKIFAVGAGVFKLNFLHFILLTFPSRLLRILTITITVSALGRIFKTSLQKHTQKWCIFYVVFWILIYLMYAYFIGQQYRG